jgi:alpha-tubulin suppressor-like RCC1 family protein
MSIKNEISYEENKSNTLYVWGNNEYGQIGFDNYKTHIVLNPSTLTLGLRIISIACGGEHTHLLSGQSLNRAGKYLQSGKQ